MMESHENTSHIIYQLYRVSTSSGPVSLSNKTSYPMISLNVDTMRLVIWFIMSFWNFTGMLSKGVVNKIVDFQGYWILNTNPALIFCLSLTN